MEHRGKPITSAYEDVRLAPKSTPLQDVDDYEFLLPGSHAIGPGLAHFSKMKIDIDDLEYLHDTIMDDAILDAQPIVDEVPPPVATHMEEDTIYEVYNIRDDSLDPSSFEKEQELWSSNPKTKQWFSGEPVPKYTSPIHHIGIQGRPASQSFTDTKAKTLTNNHLPQQQENDICTIPIVSAPSLPHNLASTEQQVLREIREFISYNRVLESHLQLSPRWIVEKAVTTEKDNCSREEALPRHFAENVCFQWKHTFSAKWQETPTSSISFHVLC